MMHHRILKYTLPATPGEYTIPANISVTHCAEQHGQLTLWGEADPNQTGESKFTVLFTGDEVISPEGFILAHVGTVLMRGGGHVVHVYQQYHTGDGMDIEY